MNTKPRYTLTEKPLLKYGDKVTVDFSSLGGGDQDYREGRIIGKSYENVFDVWIVEFDDIISESYPYKAAAIQHTFICK